MLAMMLALLMAQITQMLAEAGVLQVTAMVVATAIIVATVVVILRLPLTPLLLRILDILVAVVGLHRITVAVGVAINTYSKE